MSKVKEEDLKNPGSGKQLRLIQSCKGSVESNNIAISKYFSNNKATRIIECPIDSPYRNRLTEIKSINSNNDDENFDTPPKKIRKVLRQPIKKPIKKKKIVNSRSQNKIDSLFHRTKEKLSDFDVNPDHLQLAIALSKSTLAQENLERSKELDAEDSHNTSGGYRIGGILEKYGVKSSRIEPKIDRDELVNAIKKRKLSKFPFLKPTLLNCTAENQENLVNTKISQVLSHSVTSDSPMNECVIHSQLLQRYKMEPKILNVHKFGENVDLTHFYTSLNLPKSESVCGSLLKNWRDIAGREQSPERHSLAIDVSNQSTSSSHCLENQVKKITATCGLLKSQSCASHEATTPTELNVRSSMHKPLFSGVAQVECNFNNEFGRLEGSLKVDNLSKAEPDNVQVLSSSTLRSIPFTDSYYSDDRLREDEYNTSQKVLQQSEKLDVIEGNKEEPFKTFVSRDCSSPDIFSDGSGDEGLKQKFQDVPETLCDGFINPQSISGDSDGCFGNSPTKYSQTCNDGKMGIEHFEAYAADSLCLSQVMHRFKPDSEIDCKAMGEVIDLHSSPDEGILNKNSMYMENVSSSDKSECCIENRSNRFRADIDETTSHVGEKEYASHLNMHTARRQLPEKISFSDNIDLCNDSSSESTEIICRDMNNGDVSEEQLRNTDEVTTEQLEKTKQICHEKSYYDSVQKRSSAFARYSLAFNSSCLDVSDYIQHILNEDVSNDDQNINHIIDHDEIPSSQSANESILISDEELNYTKMQERQRTRKSKGYYELSDADNDDHSEDSSDRQYIPLSPSRNGDVVTSDGELNCVNAQHDILCTSNFKSNYRVNDNVENSDDDNDGNCFKGGKSSTKISVSQSTDEIILISDEELNSTNIQQQCISQSEVSNNLRNNGNTDKDALLEGSSVPNPLKDKMESQHFQENYIETGTHTGGADMSGYHETPDGKFLIKTRNVSPMPDYDGMTNSDVIHELKKIGVRPLKKRQGIALLKYVYDCTHPVIDENGQFVEQGTNQATHPSKKRKNSGIKRHLAEKYDERIIKKRKEGGNIENQGSPYVAANVHRNIVSSKDVIGCESPNDLLFERKCPPKTAYCKIPLQIIWFNFIESNPELKKNIVLYEPLHLNTIYAMVKEQSNCKIHIEDFIRFLDKKSITFRTS